MENTCTADCPTGFFLPPPFYLHPTLLFLIDSCLFILLGIFNHRHRSIQARYRRTVGERLHSLPPGKVRPLPSHLLAYLGGHFLAYLGGWMWQRDFFSLQCIYPLHSPSHGKFPQTKIRYGNSMGLTYDCTQVSPPSIVVGP